MLGHIPFVVTFPILRTHVAMQVKGVESDPVHKPQMFLSMVIAHFDLLIVKYFYGQFGIGSVPDPSNGQH